MNRGLLGRLGRQRALNIRVSDEIACHDKTLTLAAFEGAECATDVVLDGSFVGADFLEDFADFEACVFVDFEAGRSDGFTTTDLADFLVYVFTALVMVSL
jgi:hypothetical protein